MTVIFDKEIETDFDFDEEKTAEAVIEKAVEITDCPYEIEVNVTLTDEESIKNINSSYRNIDSVTDVLSFPMVFYDEPEKFDEQRLIDTDCFNPDSGELVLGDIIICVPKVYAQAKEYGHSVKREYAFLIAHSMMHLFGHDHMSKEEEEIMTSRQEQVLTALNISR
ncbi:MAG: rRNA maturation RNase YbeY [Eubacterium sp.]|nr:rRNA maturation RNase YbeY [Eubacterium sp.]